MGPGAWRATVAEAASGRVAWAVPPPSEPRERARRPAVPAASARRGRVELRWNMGIEPSEIRSLGHVGGARASAELVTNGGPKGVGSPARPLPLWLRRD